MKTYIVCANLTHESFGGYTHNDGSRQVEIKASSKKSAINKARKQFSPYDANITGVFTLVEFSKHNY